MNKINCIFAFLLILLPSVSAQKENVWVVTADVQNMGKISFYMLENQSENMLVTPEGRDKKLLGGFKATMLRAISKRKHDNSLVTIELKESGAINLLLLKMQLVDFKANTDSISGKIFSTDGKNEIGNLYAVKTDFSADNLEQMLDYYSIVNQINNTTVQNIYNPALVQTKKWHNFIANFKEKASIAKDDLEFVLLFYINAGKAGFSHFSLIKDEIDLERTLPEPQIEANALNDSVAYIKVRTLSGKISEIDSIFSIYQRNRIKIIDLRDMPGGVLKNTYQLASQLIADTIDGGYFVTRQCFENENCKQSPAKSDFPVLQNTDFESFTNILKNNEGVKIKLFPNKNALIPDNQQLYILINSNTASAGEPLVYGLKNSKNVIVVGEKTAGQMLSPEVFDVGNGFFLSVPIADYFTNDGKSIEGKGVTPTIKIKSEKALEWVLRKLGIK